MIQYVDTTKIYQSGDSSVTAVRDIDLKISKGEFVFLVGSCGSGKSTLIKLMLKEEEPTSGRVYVNNFNLGRMHHHDIPFLRRTIGVVFQDFRLINDRTIYENVELALRVVNASQREIRKMVPTALALVGLADKAMMKPNQISGGEQQRAVIARAIANRPDVLVADEPTGNLDPDTSFEIMSLLEDINRKGTTVIVATHAKEVVDRMKKRVVTLHNGIIISDRERGLYLDEDQECR